MPSDATPGQVLDGILAPMLAERTQRETRVHEILASLEEMQKELDALNAELDQSARAMADAVRNAAPGNPVLAAIFNVPADTGAQPAPRKSTTGVKNPDAPGADPEPSDSSPAAPAPAPKPAAAPAKADAPKPAAPAPAAPAAQPPAPAASPAAQKPASTAAPVPTPTPPVAKAA